MDEEATMTLRTMVSVDSLSFTSAGSSPAGSSGRTTGRHRLSRGGDRNANNALYIVTIARMRHHEATREYLARRTAEGTQQTRDHPLLETLHRS